MARFGAIVTRVLSYQVEEPVRKGELVLVLEGYEPSPIPVNLIHCGGNVIPLKLCVHRFFRSATGSRIESPRPVRDAESLCRHREFTGSTGKAEPTALEALLSTRSRYAVI